MHSECGNMFASIFHLLLFIFSYIVFSLSLSLSWKTHDNYINGNYRDSALYNMAISLLQLFFPFINCITLYPLNKDSLFTRWYWWKHFNTRRHKILWIVRNHQLKPIFFEHMHWCSHTGTQTLYRKKKSLISLVQGLLTK